MSDLTKWILGIVAVLLSAGIIAAVAAVWKVVRDKADKPTLAKALEVLDGEFKAVNLRIDNALIAFGQAVSKTDLIDKMGVASTRTDDQDRRVKEDILEVKTDLKSLIEKVTGIDKRLDELPARVASLEATRNKQTEK